MNSERFYELKQEIMSQEQIELEDVDHIAIELLALSVLNDLSDDYFFCDLSDIFKIANEFVNTNKDISNIKSALELKYEELADKYYDEINNDLEQDIY